MHLQTLDLDHTLSAQAKTQHLHHPWLQLQTKKARHRHRHHPNLQKKMRGAENDFGKEAITRVFCNASLLLVSALIPSWCFFSDQRKAAAGIRPCLSGVASGTTSSTTFLALMLY